jgi:hypothetical protein
VPEIKTYMPRLIQMYESGQIKATVDIGEESTTGPFRGLDSVYDAVEVSVKAYKIPVIMTLCTAPI